MIGRSDYPGAGLDPAEMAADPMAEFAVWLAAANEAAVAGSSPI